MAVELIRVNCVKCGSEVDKVEYDRDGTANAATVVASALSLSQDEAVKLLRERNAAPDQKGKALAAAIAAGTVEGRDPATYACSSCGGTDLEVQA